MSRTKTIGTIFVSLAIGALAFFFTAPKKVIKKKESETSDSQKEKTPGQDNLFI